MNSLTQSRRGSHAYGTTIFSELTREMINSVGPVLASLKASSAITLHCTENLQSGVTSEV